MADAISNQALAAQIQLYWQNLSADRQQYRDWLAGSVNGGPNGDGQYPLKDFSGATYLVKCLARVVFEANKVPVAPDLQGIGPHTLQQVNYNAKTIINASNVATVILPRTAPDGTSVLLRCAGAPLKLVPQAGGATLRNWQNHNGSAGSFALITAIVEGNSGGNSAIWTLDGTTGVLA